MKGITINDIHSYNDLGLMVAEREIEVAKPNRITESVPYQNGEYDFSDLNGEVTYGNKEITYTFDIAELDTETMEKEKRKILNWVSGLVDVEIYDDYIPNYHFKGSYSSCKWSEDFGKGEIEITFSVYPYMYANEPTEVSFEVDGTLSASLSTNSAHKVTPTITTDAEMNIVVGSTSLSIAAGTYTDVSFQLDKVNSFVFTGTGTITFSYYDEVL